MGVSWGIGVQMFLFCPQLIIFLYPATDRNMTNPTDMVLSSAKMLAVEFVIWKKQ